MMSPSEFIGFYRGVGKKKAAAPAPRLFCLAVLAGVLIGMGAAVSNTAGHALENLSVIRVVCGMLFPFGLIMVIFTGAELFTGNCLMTIPVLEREVRLSGMLRNWGIVYLGNFAGAAALAAAVVYSGQMNASDGQLAVCAVRTAAAKCALPFGRAVVLGILCNVLVCAAVTCSLCAKSVPGRAIGAFLPISFFVICGFEHSVANMFYIPVGLLALQVPQYAAAAQTLDTSALTWGGFLLGNLLPVTLGNLLGGCGFAALFWYGHRS